MKTISKNIENEIVIKKSKFISKIYYVEDINNINEILNRLKTEYKDSSHICYAYILQNAEKAYDDGEPSGTAGLPILEILKKNELINVLAIVIRYYGGIKLGTGGLLRAYSKAVRNCLINNVIPYQKMITITIKALYSQQKIIDKITNKYQIINKNFDEDIIYTLKIPEEDYYYFKNILDSYKIKEINN